MADSSEQLKRIMAMKDSLMAKIKPELDEMQGLFKSYVQNMLQENPDKYKHQQLDDKAIQKIGNVYRQITQLFWNICASLSPEQKKQMLKTINQPSNNDFINSFLNAVNSAVK
jgi:formamidopyrimidine-DNA glycosylase